MKTCVAFGAAVAGQAVVHFSWSATLYAILRLTPIRMLPVFPSLGGTGLKATARDPKRWLSACVHRAFPWLDAIAN